MRCNECCFFDGRSGKCKRLVRTSQGLVFCFAEPDENNCFFRPLTSHQKAVKKYRRIHDGKEANSETTRITG